MLSDGVRGEMEERRKERRRYPLLGRRFELTRKALALFLMVVPAVIEQPFPRAGSIVVDHAEHLRGLAELESPLVELKVEALPAASGRSIRSGPLRLAQVSKWAFCAHALDR